MNKEELINDIKNRCNGKCMFCSECIEEVQNTDDNNILEKEDCTQCRLYDEVKEMSVKEVD